MNQVELVLVEPSVFRIIHDEFEVRRNAKEVSVTECLIHTLNYSQRGLTRTEIDTCDLTFRVLIGCVIGQYASDRIGEE